MPAASLSTSLATRSARTAIARRPLVSRANPSKDSVLRLKAGVSDLLVPGDVGAWPEVSDIGHPLINQLVNRTPPITSAVQISSLALRVTQCLQPSRMISIRLAVLSRRPP